MFEFEGGDVCPADDFVRSVHVARGAVRLGIPNLRFFRGWMLVGGCGWKGGRMGLLLSRGSFPEDRRSPRRFVGGIPGRLAFSMSSSSVNCFWVCRRGFGGG